VGVTDRNKAFCRESPDTIGVIGNRTTSSMRLISGSRRFSSGLSSCSSRIRNRASSLFARRSRKLERRRQRSQPRH
jgi:hypothetical protein